MIAPAPRREARSIPALLAVVLGLLGTGPAVAARAPAPDLTRGGVKDDEHDWTLGPTGMRGWIWGRDLETTDARQILVTKVEKGSPADGVLEVGDVILGFNGKPFDADARQAFGRAITEAETADNGGILKLLCWRNGSRREAAVRLTVMGSYSETAPYDCPKSRLILEQACRHLAERRLRRDIAGQVNALAMLATGRPEFLEKVKALAHQVGPAGLKLELRPGMFAWEWGYANLFLTEYYLATGDEYVLPAIREYSRTIAIGQSAVGTWGHGMAMPGDEGRLGGYGAINQAGLGCWLSMVLAQKCGVDDAEVKRAVGTSQRFFRFYVGKGSIPYGDHPPFWDLHDNNGKNSFAAVAFDLLGDREATRFFSRMSTASYAEREYGHTGNYFSYLWGPLGVGRAGPQAVAAYLKQQRWYYDLARRWDGSFVYQGGAGAGDSYDRWDMTGVFALAYAMPLQKLYITGKGIDKANELVGEDLLAVIEDGRGFTNWHHRDCYDGKSEEELLGCLGSWSPVVRYRASQALSRKKGDFVGQLVKMLAGDDLNARYGACQALEYLRDRAAPATDPLLKLLAHPDQWLRIRASYALAGIGKPARRAANEMLRLSLVEDKNDPREMMRRYLCLALFLGGYVDNAPRRGLLADSLDGIDRQLLIPAVQRMLLAEDGLSRSQLASVYRWLSNEELEGLWPDVLRAVEKPAPSGEMFSDGIRLASLDLLAKHHVEEGMRVSLAYARTQNPWASENRMWEIMKSLKSYGAAARPLLPELRELATACRNERDFPDDCKKKKTAAVEDAIKAIEAATEQPQLRSIAPPQKGVKEGNKTTAVSTRERLGEMITIPAGSFLMGNNGHEGSGGPEEFPQHSVNLPAFQIGKYEVTRGQYRRFIEAGGYRNPSYWSAEGWKWKESNVIDCAGMYGQVTRTVRPNGKENRNAPEHWAAEQEWIGHGFDHPRFIQTDNHPVVGVTYYEAEAYCKWAGGRLPTEAEWEKAARWDERKQHANTWPWGDTWDPEKCNNAEDHNPAAGGYKKNQSAPVGSYPNGASPYGCMDMAGNAYEWVADWHKSYPGGSKAFDHTNAYRSVKGACWDDGPSSVRCACRVWYLPPSSSGTGPGDSDYIGFRVAR